MNHSSHNAPRVPRGDDAMMRNAIVSVMAGLVLCSTAAAAVQRSTTALALTRRTDALTEADYFDLTPPDSLGIRENAELLSAFLELHIAVEPGRSVALRLFDDNGKVVAGAGSNPAAGGAGGVSRYGEASEASKYFA